MITRLRGVVDDYMTHHTGCALERGRLREALEAALAVLLDSSRIVKPDDAFDYELRLTQAVCMAQEVLGPRLNADSTTEGQ